MDDAGFEVPRYFARDTTTHVLCLPNERIREHSIFQFVAILVALSSPLSVWGRCVCVYVGGGILIPASGSFGHSRIHD